MRSKTSFFDKAICLNFIKRFWPLWLAWQGLLLLMLPAQLPSLIASAARYPKDVYYIESVNRTILQGGDDVAIMAFFACVLMVMAMYSYLYNSRSCSMMNSLPVRRETMFVTAFVTGLVPMLAAELISAAVTAIILPDHELIAVSHVWSYLGSAMLATVAFYGMASFCAMLTGNLIMLPVVYVVLNLSAILAEGGIKSVLNQFIYGFVYDGMTLMNASPFAAVISRVCVMSESVPIPKEPGVAGSQIDYATLYRFEGMGLLAVYSFLGLALAAFALWLYKRRNMECVGDVVAIPVLRPIFKYAMSFGVAFCFTAIIFSVVFERITSGTSEAVAVMLLLLAGSFLGYFISEMLLQKTLRVFRGKWKGFCVVAIILVAFVLGCEADIPGYERRIPDADDVESVEISYYGVCELDEYENISRTTQFHRQLIEQKAVNEQADMSESIVIRYYLKNGSDLARMYYMADEAAQHADPNSNIMALSELVNVPEAVENRLATDIPVDSRYIVNAYINSYYVDDEGLNQYTEVKLTAEQMEEFYNQCVMADIHKSHLGHIWTVRDEEYYDLLTTVNVSFGLVDEESSVYEYERNHYYYDFNIYMDAERCCRWIEENTGIVPVSLREADPNQLEWDQDLIGTRAISSSDGPTAIFVTDSEILVAD